MTLAREMLVRVPGDAKRQTRARVNALVFARRLAAHGDLPRPPGTAFAAMNGNRTLTIP